MPQRNDAEEDSLPESTIRNTGPMPKGSVCLAEAIDENESHLGGARRKNHSFRVESDVRQRPMSGDFSRINDFSFRH